MRNLPPRSVKEKARTLVRDVLGLHIRFARARGFDLKNYEMNVKYASRLLHFERLLRQIDNVEGRIVECGVGPGRSIFAFLIISQSLARPRELWGFDTFQGLPRRPLKMASQTPVRLAGSAIHSSRSRSYCSSIELIRLSFPKIKDSFPEHSVKPCLAMTAAQLPFSPYRRRLLRVLQDRARAIVGNCGSRGHSRIRRISQPNLARSNPGN